MEIKSILVPFAEEPSATLGFDAAAIIAKKFNAHISAAHIRQRPVPSMTVVYPLGGVFTEFTEQFQETENKLAEDLQKLFNDLCERHSIVFSELSAHSDEMGTTASWSDTEGELFSDMSQKAMSSDVASIGVTKESSPLSQELAEELLFQSGRPVLLTPEEGMKAAPERIVIAWNGRQEAARAVMAAFGLLKEAESVKILSVRKAGMPPVNTDEITAYLRLHKLEATETEIELEEDKNETARLEKEILNFKADLVVMGAYSHSRWREAVLGGFTKHMLQNAPVPVLMMR